MEKSQQCTKIQVPANLRFSSGIRHICADIFESVGFSKRWQEKLKLVIDEVFMNAVKYGSSDNSFINITLQKLEPHGVKCEISDTGSGMQKMSASDLKALIEDRKSNTDVLKTSGRGLAMFTMEWTDEFDISDNADGGLTISFSKYVKDDDDEETPSKPRTAEEKTSISTGAAANEKIITLEGEIDQLSLSENIQKIEKTLREVQSNTTVILDMKDVSYVNSIFIGHLAKWSTDLKGRANCTFTLRDVNKTIYDTLKVVGLTQLFTVIPAS